MSDGFQPSEEVAKSRKGLMVALLGILVVVAAIVAVMYLVGFGPFAAPAEEPVVTKPAAETSEEADEADEETTTPVASSATVPLPPAAAQEAMYWEQVASADRIGELMDNRFATFEFSQIAESADLANIRVKATYRDGATMSGWITLKNYEGAWYFSTLMADGGSSAPAPDLGDPDPDIVKAMVEQQAANQDVYKAILDGTYSVITIDKVVVGSGVRTLEITLSGTAKAGDKAKVTAITSDNGSGSQWFITAFSQ